MGRLTQLALFAAAAAALLASPLVGVPAAAAVAVVAWRRRARGLLAATVALVLGYATWLVATTPVGASRFAMLIAMPQIVTRVPRELADQLDELVADGVFTSRSDAVRQGLEEVIDRERRRRIGAAIVEGYRRHPPTEEELAGIDDEVREMIEEEPW